MEVELGDGDADVDEVAAVVLLPVREPREGVSRGAVAARAARARMSVFCILIVDEDGLLSGVF